MAYLTLTTALEAHERVTGRFSALLRTADDGGRKVPHLTWTVGETGAHVLCYLRRYPEMLAGVSTGWESLGDGERENARLLADVPEREPWEIADAIDLAAPTFREAFAGFTEDLAPWHAGLRIPPEALVGMMVGDVLVHGWDIATALGETWPIDPSDASLSFAATVPVLPHAVDAQAARGFSARYGIQLPRRARVHLHVRRRGIDGGRGPPVPCRLSDVGRAGGLPPHRLREGAGVAPRSARQSAGVRTAALARPQALLARGRRLAGARVSFHHRPPWGPWAPDVVRP